MEKSSINIYKCWIFQQATSDYRRVSSSTSINSQKNIGELHVWDFAASSLASVWHWSEWGKWSIIPAQKMCSQWKIVSGFAECCIVVLAWKRKERLRGPPAIPWSPSVLRLLRHWNHTGDNPRPMSQWFSRTQSVYIYVDIDNECMLIYNVMSVML